MDVCNAVVAMMMMMNVDKTAQAAHARSALTCKQTQQVPGRLRARTKQMQHRKRALAAQSSKHAICQGSAKQQLQSESVLGSNPF